MRRQAAVLVGVLGLLAGCSGTTSAGDAGGAPGVTGAPSGVTAPSSEASTPASDVPTGDGRTVPRVDVPFVPPIVLPDVSVLGSGGDKVEQSVGALATPTAGVDVVGAACAAQGGDLVYQGGDGDSFFDVATDGAGTYSDVGGDANVTVVVAEDGSGTYSDLGGDNAIMIEAQPDGSGTYSDTGGDNALTIEVAADGSGTYSDLGGDRNLTIAILPDGSGSLVDAGGDRNLTIDAKPDGSGTYTDLGGDRNVTITALPDGSWTYTDVSVGTDLSLEINADGSGRFVDGGSGLTITVDGNGHGTYVDDDAGAPSTFTTDIGILDPEVLIAGPRPVFAVADRFPPVDRLGRLSPPCATVIRLEADVLFDFDSDRLRPEAAPVVASVAEAVTGSGQTVEVQGHTDSKGADGYNQDLSERRAESFKAALVAAGVTSEITTTGFGETRPVAPNERPDGSDDPAGRQLNRRVEVVFPG